jgi:hypothetical protein
VSRKYNPILLYTVASRLGAAQRRGGDFDDDLSPVDFARARSALDALYDFLEDAADREIYGGHEETHRLQDILTSKPPN